MTSRSRLVLVSLVLAAALVAPPAASAVKSGSYKGTDISFRVKKNRVSKLKVVLVYSCQTIGTGNLPDGETRSLNVPGKTGVSSKGKFKRDVYIGSNNGVTDIFFNWKGRFRKGKVTTTVQSGYKYTKYDPVDGFHLVSCYNTTRLTAKRR
jgi:hypothetical protein